MPTSKKLSRAEISALRDLHTVPLRDLATRLLDDPVDADDVVEGALRALQRASADTVGTGAQAERYLRENVVDRCIRRFARNVAQSAGASSEGRRGRAA